MTALDVSIVGWGTAVPSDRITNADLEARMDTSDAWIVERTGIHERRVAAEWESTATLGADAGAAAIKSAGLGPDAIDLLIVSTATPEQPLPHTGAFIGEALGLRCGSFDISAACSGFVYELVVGASMLHIGCEHVLIVSSETMTRFADPCDRATAVLFGDGAAAAVLARDTAPGIVGWDLGCDGSATSLLEIPAGGSRRPTTAETVAARDHYLKMAGKEVFRRAVRAIVSSARVTLQRCGLDASDITWFVPHQANARIIEAAAERMGFSSDRTLVNVDRCGNTSSASIPLALFEAVDAGLVQDGDLILCSGFGAGMTWGTAVVRWRDR